MVPTEEGLSAGAAGPAAAASAEQARLDALGSQLEELVAVQACYPEELQMASVERDNLRFAQAVVESSSSCSGGSAARAADVPSLSGTLRLPGAQLAGEPVQLAFVLPKQGGAPRLQVHTSAPREQADLLQRVADSTAAECAADGSPCLLVVADTVAEAASQLAESAAEQRQHAGEQQPAAADSLTQQQLQPLPGGGRGGGSSGRSLVLSRRCLVFHHIKNLNKRKAILQWGSELGLGGWSKPGFPGLVLVEGACDDVAEYISRLRHLRWQSMVVRAEEDLAVGSQQELEAARVLPRGVQELGEEEMGRLAAAAREAGMEALFRQALNLGPASGGG